MHTHHYALDTTWRTLLKDMGIVPANVLRRAGLADDLFQQSSARLASEDYYRFWEGVEREAADPLLPIRICESIRSESFSPLLFAALCSPNLLVATQRIAHYKTLIGPIRLDVAQASDTVTFRLTWLDTPLLPPTSLVLMELLFGVAIARLGTREPIQPLAVTTTVLPTVIAPYEAYLGTRILPGAEHEIMFTLADATRPFLTSNEQLWSVFEPELRQRLAGLEGSATTAQRVRAALLESLPSGLATIEATTKRLAVSRRTLQRRIEAEGTSFQTILRETREALARHYLERTALSPAEISFLLGFDEPNSFYRAFKDWTGMTPDGLRRANR